MVHKYIYKIGTNYRNPSLKKYYEILKNSEHFTLEELKICQFKKLKELLIFAYQYSNYYKRVFDENRFNPYEICSINDIKRLPVIEKDELIKYNSDIHTKYKFNKLFLSDTSGTSGKTLKFYRNEEWDSCN